MPRWLTLPVCMSSRTRPWPATLLAKTASGAGTESGVPTMFAGPAPSVAIICAWRAQGSVWASKAQARKSRRQVFSFSAATAGTATSRWRTIAAAMRSASVAGAAEGADGRTAVAASDI